MQILRLPGLRAKYPKGRSSIYVDVKHGVLPPPISLGPRCSGWPSNEIDQVISARVSGASVEEVKQLVAQLVSQRRSAA